MNGKELARNYKVTQQHIRALTKQSANQNKPYIEINNDRYSYELKKTGRGRPAYFYTKYQSDCIKKSIKEANLNVVLKDKQKKKLDLKLEIMSEFEVWKQFDKGSVKEFIAYINKTYDVSYTYRKHNLWEKSYKSAGARALVDKRGRQKGDTKLSSEQQRFLIRNFRAFGAGEVNYTQLWEDLHRYEQDMRGFDFEAWKQNRVKNLCDRGVVQRFISSYYEKRVIEFALVTKGEDMNKSLNQPAMGKRASTYRAKNQCWEIDSTPADVIIFHEGNQIRPDILAIKDCYSGRCVANLAIKSNTLAIIRLLWKAIETLGVPKMIKGDNGRDYVSSQFQNLCKNLGIKYIKATAYDGSEKGMIERGFRTLQHSYMRVLVGFIGHNVSHRQKIEQQTAKKHRKAKDEFGNMVKTQTPSSELLSWDEFDDKLQEAIFLWEVDKKRRRGESPIELWNSCPKKKVTMDYENFLIYAGGVEKRTVQKEGINFDGRKYISPFIGKLRGQKVYVSENIDNISEIFVFDDKGNYLGKCIDASISPMSKEDFIKAKKDFVKKTANIQKLIKDDKISARSKANIKVDYQKAKDMHKSSLKSDEIIHLDSEDIKQRADDQVLGYEDMTTLTVDVSSGEENSIYEDWAIDY